MRKVLGVILTIVGGLWGLIFLITGFDGWQDFGAGSWLATLFLVGIGVVVFIVGIKLINKKKEKTGSKKNKTEETPKKGKKEKEQESAAKPKVNTPLKDVRHMVEQKVADVNDEGYQISKQALRDNLMGLNGEKMPFEIFETNDGNAELMAHWRLADAEYLDLLGVQKNKQQAEFDVLMKFDEAKGVLRCKDKLKSKSSSFGMMGGGMEFSSFSGKAVSGKKEIVIGRKKDGSIGKVVDISLDTTILQNAIKAVAEKSGWTVKRVAGKL